MKVRCWYRLHSVTATALIFVGICLAWSAFAGSQHSLKYLWVGTRSFGWPWEHFDGMRAWSSARAAANFLVGCAILLGVAGVLERLVRTPTRKPQFRLATLLAIMAVVAVLTCLLQSEADWPSQRPLGRSSAGILCPFASGSSLAWAAPCLLLWE